MNENMLYPPKNGAERDVSANVDASCFEDRKKALEAAGYTPYFNASIGENLFAGYQKNGQSIYFYYLAARRELRELRERYVPLPVYELSEKVCDTSLWHIGYDFRHNGYNTEGKPVTLKISGQGEVFVLEDGSYIIIDGGIYNTDAQAGLTRMYEWLRDNNRRRDGKIVIAAWLITHVHNDHCNLFELFSQKYGKNENVEVKYFVYNYPIANQMLTYKAGLCGNDINDIDRVFGYIFDNYYDRPPVVFIPRTGQRLHLGNWTVEILSTYDNLDEDTYDKTSHGWTNDLGMPFLFLANEGQADEVRILFLGDIYATTSNLLVELYGDYLRCPMVQAAHHGYKDGGSELLYQTVRAEHVLWTNSLIVWNQTKYVPSWLRSANENVVAYPQCNEDKTLCDWFFTFEDGKIQVKKQI